MSDEDLEKIIKEVVEKNKGAPFGALMGQAMKATQGKVDGKRISEILKNLTQFSHKILKFSSLVLCMKDKIFSEIPKNIQELLKKQGIETPRQTQNRERRNEKFDKTGN